MRPVATCRGEGVHAVSLASRLDRSPVSERDCDVVVARTFVDPKQESSECSETVVHSHECVRLLAGVALVLSSVDELHLVPTSHARGLPALAAGRNDAHLPASRRSCWRPGRAVPLPAALLRVVAPRRRHGRGRGQRASGPLEPVADVERLRTRDPRAAGEAREGDRPRRSDREGSSDMILTCERRAEGCIDPLSQVRGTRGGSSVGQSSGLIIRRSQVQVLPAPPIHLRWRSRSWRPHLVEDSLRQTRLAVRRRLAAPPTGGDAETHDTSLLA